MGGVNQITHRAKKLTMFFAIMLTILVTLPEEGKGNCPTGYSGGTAILTYNSHTYTVHFCYRCTSSTHSGPDILLNGWETTSAELPSPGLYTAIRKAVLDNLVLSCSFPPCNEPNVETIHFKTYLCYATQNVLFAPPLPTPPPTSQYCHDIVGGEFQRYVFFCDESNYCIEYVEVCFDYSTNEVQSTVVNKQQYGSPGCSATTTIPPTGINWCQPWTSDCRSVFDCSN